MIQWQPINKLIEEAIINADQKGCKVLTLGLLNQASSLYIYIYISVYPSSFFIFDTYNLKEMCIKILQGDELNKHGALYVQRNPKLKVRVVDGNSLAVGVVLNNIPKFATQVLLIGKVTKLAFAIYHSLSKRGIQIVVLNEQNYKRLNRKPSNYNYNTNINNNNNNFEEPTLLLSTASSQNVNEYIYIYTSLTLTIFVHFNFYL